ncbi:hypothetical protein EVAR_99164_1 [Eumeta japonica]|uniref:Uncharacterized protein n=1 Tax=Eumeta variegata TaxID=151549 RepID=A0A4C1SCP3_EUMVA|nr:hypothetical protein EVAR_99164_1 [Eumeta japonica]
MCLAKYGSSRYIDVIKSMRAISYIFLFRSLNWAIVAGSSSLLRHHVPKIDAFGSRRSDQRVTAIRGNSNNAQKRRLTTNSGGKKSQITDACRRSGRRGRRNGTGRDYE